MAACLPRTRTNGRLARRTTADRLRRSDQCRSTASLRARSGFPRTATGGALSGLVPADPVAGPPARLAGGPASITGDGLSALLAGGPASITGDGLCAPLAGGPAPIAGDGILALRAVFRGDG